jgi:alkanesulfonate monooxygenase SsuD/methylene tetrahydromethanopterin reductase-like flavin-dependent oxidoreductase (luciferase family)
MTSVDGVREGAGRLRAACEQAGRDPGTLRLSIMTGFVAGADEAGVRAYGERMMAWEGATGDVGAWLAERRDEGNWLVGTPGELVEQLRAFAAVGVERVALQHNLFADVDVLALIGRDVLPAVAQ